MKPMCKHPTCPTDGPCRRPVKPGIKKMSAKRAKQNTVYLAKSHAFRKLFPLCQIKSPDCTIKSQGIHHLKGKATEELLMDETLWKSACNACNLYVEVNAKWGFDTGNKLSKFL